MRDFKRSGPLIKMKLTDYEATLLESLVDQFSGLLEDGSAPLESSDPFERLAAESVAPELDTSDPVIARLFRTPIPRTRGPRPTSDGSPRPGSGTPD